MLETSEPTKATKTAPDSKFISNVQVLRALAALGVVFFHTGYLLPGGIATEFHGVAVFFVISGFIIPRVGYKSAADFFLNRFLRIVPIYWVATLASASWFREPHQLRGFTTALALAAALAPSGKVVEFMRRRTAASRAAWFVLAVLAVFAVDFLYRAIHHMSPEALSVLWRSFFFLPLKQSDGSFFPTLGVGWSLNMEIFFYVLFGIFLCFSRRAAAPLTGLVLLALRWLYVKGAITGPYAEFYGQENVQYFAYGMALYYLFVVFEKMPRERIQSPSARSGSALLIGATIALYLLALLRPQTIGFPLAPVFIVAAALLGHLTGLRIESKTLLLLGNASYSIYLFHTFFVETFKEFSSVFPPLATTTLLGMCLTIAASTIISVDLHRFLELPLVARCRGFIDQRRTPR